MEGWYVQPLKNELRVHSVQLQPGGLVGKARRWSAIPTVCGCIDGLLHVQPYDYPYC